MVLTKIFIFALQTCHCLLLLCYAKKENILNLCQSEFKLNLDTEKEENRILKEQLYDLEVN